MKFRLKPILSEIKDLNSKPISADRFKEYISKLQGDTKGDMSLPIAGFNPMAKNHMLSKIEELKNLDAEYIMQKTIDEFNSSIDLSISEDILVVLNIADDLKGAWTNYYSTDFDSKFKLNAFVKRRFSVPYFWTSEIYSQSLIQSRTIEYMSRTLYWLSNSKPATLEEHFEQEVFVASNANLNNKELVVQNHSEIEKFYLENKNSDEQDKIFNFFYGDEGKQEYNLPELGDVSKYITPEIIQRGNTNFKNLKDVRIKAFAAMAPAIGQGFNQKEQFENVDKPILIIGAEKDERTPVETNAKHYHRLIDHSEYVELKGNVGHYIFMNEAKSGLKRGAPLIFKDDKTVKRDEQHDKVATLIIEFFGSQLP